MHIIELFIKFVVKRFVSCQMYLFIILYVRVNIDRDIFISNNIHLRISVVFLITVLRFLT